MTAAISTGLPRLSLTFNRSLLKLCARSDSLVLSFGCDRLLPAIESEPILTRVGTGVEPGTAPRWRA
jgi:hypothetical protein